jgi:hypothetical protein
MVQMLQSQNYGLQQLTRFEGCALKSMKEENERLFKSTPLYTIS